jgi:hypothetical protein
MKRFYLLVILLFATTATADNVDKGLTWNPTIGKFQAVTHANGTKNINEAVKPIAVQCSIIFTSGGAGSCSTRSEGVMPSYATSAQTGGGAAVTTGTLTVTINRTGYYQACATLSLSAASVFTGPAQINNIWGGTGTLYQSQSRDLISIPSPNNDISLTGCRIYSISSGQTITVNSSFSATGTSPTGNSIYMIIPL